MTTQEVRAIPGERIYRRCAAVARSEDDGKMKPCPYRAVMTWHSVGFCGNHAPPRRPGQTGWARLDNSA